MSPDESLPAMDVASQERFLGQLSAAQVEETRWHWDLWARPEQLPPPGDWRVWLILAGRGFGKTRAGAEWVRAITRSDPDAHVALIAASLGDARAVMVEGESGLLAVGAPDRAPKFEPSLRRLTWDNGAQATLYSAAEPETLRGPQHSHAWCDELGKWAVSANRAERCWDNLLLGLRLGEAPRILATTTPRAVPLLRRLLAEEASGEVVVTRGSSRANAANLPLRFLNDMAKTYGQSALGRQELEGEMLDDLPGALWTRAMIEQARASTVPPMKRVIIGVDPPASAHGDACGIVVCGLGDDGLAYVQADLTVEKASPERWARAVASAWPTWHADRVVAEANQGGEMVGSVLRAANAALPIKLVHARHGKGARAEPVAALYECGRVRHAGTFPQLEDELCGLMVGGEYRGPGRSPDRADACVWALTELMLGHAAEPRVRLA